MQPVLGFDPGTDTDTEGRREVVMRVREPETEHTGAHRGRFDY